MVECKWRQPLSNPPKLNGEVFYATTDGGTLSMGAAGLRSNFKNGVCLLLTANDFGPVACRRPQNHELDCPDIEGVSPLEEAGS